MTGTAEAAGLPFDEAVRFFRQKANVTTEHWTDLEAEAHSRAFAVAGAASDALVEDFRKAVDKAISQGTGFGAFKKDFDDIVKRHGWVHKGHPEWRARVIYETNMSTAFAAGRYVQMTQPATLAAFPYWEYVHTPVAHPRLWHLAWNGLTLRADDPFWDAHYPPSGWGCRCFVSPTSEGGLRRMGKSGPDQAPAPQFKEWIDKRTGEVKKIPVGVDPGWGFNPGKAWKERSGAGLTAPKLVPEKARAAAAVLAKPGADAVAPELLRAFIEAPEGSVQVGELPDAVRKALDTKAKPALLSADTMVKQKREHPDLAEPDYRDLLKVLASPDAVLDNGKLHVRLIGRGTSRAVSVIVKTTHDRRENYVKSFHFADAKSIGQFIKRERLLWGSVEDLLAWLKSKRAR